MAKNPVKAADPAADPVADPVAKTMIVVMGPAKGRWRIGRYFGRDPVAIAASDLTEAQAIALQDDPELSISFVGLAD